MPADDAVSELKGVGETTEAKLEELGVTTVGELAGLESEEHASLVEKAQAYLSDPEDTQDAEASSEAPEDDAAEGEPEDDSEDAEEASDEDASEAPEDAEDAEEPSDDEEDADEEDPDALVKARIHAGKPETKAYLEELLDHEVRDYKRYTVEIPREDLNELLETAGQPHVTPLA